MYKYDKVMGVLGIVHTYLEICENTNFFLRIRLASTRIQRIFRPYPEIFENALQSGNFLSDTSTYTCGRLYPEIFEYAFVILLDPVYTASIINKHGVQQGCSFFVSYSDF